MPKEVSLLLLLPLKALCSLNTSTISTTKRSIRPWKLKNIIGLTLSDIDAFGAVCNNTLCTSIKTMPLMSLLYRPIQPAVSYMKRQYQLIPYVRGVLLRPFWNNKGKGQIILIPFLTAKNIKTKTFSRTTGPFPIFHTTALYASISGRTVMKNTSIGNRLKSADPSL